LFVIEIGIIYNCYNVTIHEYRLDVRTSDGIYVLHKHEYGMKIFIMNVSDTFHVINAMAYININVGSKPLGSYYVRKISEPIHNSYRNITCRNNWLILVSLVESMLEKFSQTVVHSLQKCKSCIPSLFKRAPAEYANLLIKIIKH